MADEQAMSSFWRGVKTGFPFLFVAVPFAMLFGVLATEAGLTLFETMSFSFVVIAGAAQFTALSLLNENAPAIVALISAIAVNMRLVMYSAALTPYLGPLPLWKRVLLAYFLVDQTYASSQLEFEARPAMTLTQRFAFFLGVMIPICPPWFLGTWFGAWAGEAIDMDSGLDFALPIAFIAMIGPALRTPAHRVAALVSVIFALGFAWLPFNFGLIVGGLAGMAAGAEAERRMSA